MMTQKSGALTFRNSATRESWAFPESLTEIPDEKTPSWKVIRISLLLLLTVVPEMLKSAGRSRLIASRLRLTGGVVAMGTAGCCVPS